jgi:hypothetical protein
LLINPACDHLESVVARHDRAERWHL